METKEILREITKNRHEIFCVVGKVISVNETERTCDVKPINGDAIIYSVRLQADIIGEGETGTGFWLMPKTGSNVIVAFLNDNVAVIVLSTDIDKLECAIEGISICMTKDGLVFNGGNLGGLVKVKAIKDRLNSIEQAFNNHITEFNTHIHAGMVVSPPATGSTTPPSTLNIQPTSLEDIENNQIIQ
ncbi:MAG: hypothetical protein NTW49_02930 [Bacteroidia bacterium]|nr:hypothetical protein [Bacteroidia bacterium]